MIMETMGDQDFTQPSKHGLKLKLNHVYPIDSKQIIKLKPKHVMDFMPITTRYFAYYVGRKMHHKRPIMDYVYTKDAERKHGCPLGGIGGGTIGRGFKGEFCRFQLYPGLYEYVTVPECQFIVNIRNSKNETIFQSVLSTYDKPKNAPASWEWNLNGADCEYTALYPRAWTTYDLTSYGVHLTCRQISPVIPHNYKDSSLPCAVFVFTAKNLSKEQLHVSISFTWTEISPYKSKSPKKDNHVERYTKENTCGVSLEQKIGDFPCTYTIAKHHAENETIFENYCTFNAAKSSKYVWECLKKKGKLEPDNSQEDKKEKSHGKHASLPDSIGLSSVLSLEPGMSAETEFSLVWDMPVVKFKKESRWQNRFYTKYFGSDGIAGPTIAKYALDKYKNWEKQISEWQDPILTNSNIPDWLKSALMNELYFVADGGTIWFTADEEFPPTDPRHDFGVFGYLEGHEYRMYNTYDVHFYASFALAQLWPNLQVVIQYMFRDTIKLETQKCRVSLYGGKSIPYKVKDSIPHDLGDPQGEPFKLINAYNVHDVSEWRDLNAKYILQVMRDYRLLKAHSAPFENERYRSLDFIDDGTEDQLYHRSTEENEVELIESPASSLSETPVHVPNNPSPAGNILEMLYRNEVPDDASEHTDAAEERASFATWDARRYLADMYESCAALLRRMLEWDKDGDGLIENSGWPDQTYDSWVMTGPSAYCGGLWIAAVCCVRAMARVLGREEDEKEFKALAEKAKLSFEEKLWCGTHYRFDATSKKRVVMSDQLAGQWYLRACGLSDDLLPAANVRKALRTVYENNVLKFGNGKMGAVNGYVLADKGKPGRVDVTSLQSMEMWTGVTYGVAALMLHEGMHEEAFATAGGMYTTLTQMGLSFETPEALFENGHHRSVAYMRPLSIWAMYQAITARPPPPKPTAMANGQSQKQYL